jgi:FAD/FMN-containing dehydrogenase
MELRGEDGIEGLRSDLVSAGCRLAKLAGGGDAMRRWNGALDPHPILVAQCSTAEQISAALRAVRRAGKPVSVHGGGQDWVGRSLRDGSVVLDLSAMTSIGIDAARREAVIGGGVTARLLNEAAGEHKLVPVIGSDGAVGMPGLFMGGGYGPLMTRFGLACDNLLSAEVVMADGTIVHCDADQEPDLFWALRGGGGNFGIVTSARLRLHQLSTVVGTFAFGWADARAVMAVYGDMMGRAPAELFGAFVLAVGPGGEPVVVVSLVWTGEQQSKAVMAPLMEAGRPLMAKTEPMEASALLTLNDGKLAQGRAYDVGTRWFSVLSSEVVDALLAAFEERTSPLSSIIVHHCHGAATQVPATATAFGMRQPHFTALAYSAWEPASTDSVSPHRRWMRGLMERLAPLSLPGGYANLLDDQASAQIAHAYGPNASRLTQLKRRYDPDGIFRAIPLPEGGDGPASG